MRARTWYSLISHFTSLLPHANYATTFFFFFFWLLVLLQASIRRTHSGRNGHPSVQHEGKTCREAFPPCTITSQPAGVTDDPQCKYSIFRTLCVYVGGWSGRGAHCESGTPCCWSRPPADERERWRLGLITAHWPRLMLLLQPGEQRGRGKSPLPRQRQPPQQ